jgi:hypothetical protein
MKKVVFPAASTGVLSCLCTMGLMSIGVNPAVAADLSSHVETAVVREGDFWRYNFTLFNDSTDGAELTDRAELTEWAIPLFSEDDIVAGSITGPGYTTRTVSPTESYAKGWFYALLKNESPQKTIIETNRSRLGVGDYDTARLRWTYRADQDSYLASQSDKYGNNPSAFDSPAYMLRWFTGYGYDATPTFSQLIHYEPDPLTARKSLQFSFLSKYLSKAAPYQAQWWGESYTIGDPGTPNSPARQSAQGTTDVPTPALLPGLASLGIGSWLKRRKQAATLDAA